jgi:uncharacterized protein involved in exopolysaccharide biosynthesis
MTTSRQPELFEEREVDLRATWARLTTRWWLPVGGLVAGIALGVLLALGGGSVYRAEAILFLGQPFTAAGGGQIQSLATNPRTVAEIVRSEAALRAASRAAGVPVSKLRGAIATQPITSPGQTRNTTPLVELSVTLDGPRKAERAADALAKRVIDNVSEYVENKIAVLNDQIENDNRELAEINRRIANAQQQQALILNNDSLPLAERLLLLTNINSTIGFAEQRRGTVQEDLLQARQLLSQAELVERSRIVEPAVATKTTARSARNAAAVGGLLGLLLGAVAALVWDGVAARRAR